MNYGWLAINNRCACSQVVLNRSLLAHMQTPDMTIIHPLKPSVLSNAIYISDLSPQRENSEIKERVASLCTSLDDMHSPHVHCNCQCVNQHQTPMVFRYLIITLLLITLPITCQLSPALETFKPSKPSKVQKLPNVHAMSCVKNDDQNFD